ncbi:MAG: type IV secretion system protein [Betaproteobacteria bacterium]|nr:type IV secretion system protein [Betaproteobacteria bacterium]
MINLSPSIIDQFSQSFLEGGRSLHGNLSGVADSLYGSLLLLTFSWFGINALLESMMGENLGKVLSRLIRFLFLSGLVAWFLQAYDFVFYEGVYKGCDAVAAAIAGPGGSGQGFATAWGVFTDIIVTVWDAVAGSPARYLNGASPLSWAFWGAFGGWMMTVALLFLALCVFILALAILAVIYVMSNALAGLALALGPFFIPWLLWDVTKDFFMAWVRFLFIACFYRVVSVSVLVMSKPVFAMLHQWMTDNAAVMTGASPSDSMALAVLLVITGSIMAYLMSHVPQISAALIGHARVDTGFATQSSRAIQSRVSKANDWMGRRLRDYARSAERGATRS